jgi:hypothetical protein
MNDIYELWSLPWHVLQKSLAGGIRAHGDSQSAAKRGRGIREQNPLHRLQTVTLREQDRDVTHGEE